VHPDKLYAIIIFPDIVGIAVNVDSPIGPDDWGVVAE